MNTNPSQEREDVHAKEGEFFVDQAEKPIPPRNTWHELDFQQLLELKLQLEDKAWAFAKNPVISKTVNQGLRELEALIASRI